VLGALLWVAVAFFGPRGTRSNEVETKAAIAACKLLFLLLLFMLLGATYCAILLSPALSCLVFPRDLFLSGDGKKLLRYIGTKSVVVARAVGLIVALILIGSFLAIGLLFWSRWPPLPALP
jgi:hypothetical protein